MAPVADSMRSAWSRHQALLFPTLMAASVLVIIVPLPPFVLDLLLSCNITMSVVILLTTIYVGRPLDFSVFPSLLLGTTLARLVLNVASTRLILTNSNTSGTAAAGGVIQAFGDFVAGGQVAIGVIIFVILIAIQFLVITKGATRISEVAARFALDGMPGKQMAIDADLNAGIITAEQARRRREEVAQQADFYGAMDGASKFVRGDAIAGIVITLVNILGGLYIGMVNHGMELSRAVEVFTKLTIGDGLVSQVPAFLIALASGLLVTRTSSESDLPRDIVSQMLHHPQSLWVAACFLAGLAFTGLPAGPMIGLSAGCAVLATGLARGQKQRALAQKRAELQQQQTKPPPKPEDYLHVDALELELGFGLLQLADPNKGGDLLDRVTMLRQLVAQELGMILPKVRIRDSILLGQRHYQIKIHDVPVAGGEIYPDGLLAIDMGNTTGRLQGIETKEPAFGRPAWWIEPAHRDRAVMLGFRIVEPSAVIVTHLKEVVKDHSPELLSREQVHELLQAVKQHSPKVVEELIPDMLKVPQVHQVLANLLRERVPIRNLDLILQTLSDYADRTKDLGILTEYVRHRLSRAICQQYRDAQRTLRCVTLDPALEDVLAAGMEYGERGLTIKLSPQTIEGLLRGLKGPLETLSAAGLPPIVLCSPAIRAGLKQLTSAAVPRLVVLSLNEVTRDTEIETVGQVGLESVRGGTLVGAGRT